ncbi:hypothetical protein RhiirA5_423146 [Rhizophagus irregularis]|uniref:Uncharacterized protein n=1 Tax=Rhizophagus irregularis TaxID=588596 RepID=A0A2N0PAI9_9GLOM|nr:hypothetical protein RhiirA5_423146 [Rhizophagus irregularis]
MDNKNKSDKMDKPDKPDKVNKLKKMDGISKMKLMDFCNEKIMRKSIFIAFIVLLMTVFVQDESKWKSLNHMVLKILIPGMPHLPHPVHNPVVEQFTSCTTDLFRDISLAKIPAPGEITRHVDSYNTLAIMLRMSPAHKNTGASASRHLENYSELLYKAGDALREMFVESKTVHNTFEIEVKSMIDKFSRTPSIFMNSDFFKIRILKLEKAIMEFRTMVDDAMKLIIEVQQKTKVVSESLFEAQVEVGDYNIDNTGKRNFDLTAEAINDIKNMRGHLDETAAGLKEVHGKLKDYEINMNKVKANLGVTIYEITNESLQHLKAAVDLWRESQTKFFNKQKKRAIGG